MRARDVFKICPVWSVRTASSIITRKKGDTLDLAFILDVQLVFKTSRAKPVLFATRRLSSEHHAIGARR